MFSALDEIAQQLRQNPRLIIADDFEFCLDGGRSHSVQYENGETVGQRSESVLWAGLRIAHRKRPGRSSAFISHPSHLNDLVEQAFAAASGSSPDPWFRLPLWKPKVREMSSDDAEVSFNDLPASHSGDVPLSVFERYEYEARAIHLYRKTEKAALKQFYVLDHGEIAVRNPHAEFPYRINTNWAGRGALSQAPAHLAQLARSSQLLEQGVLYQGGETLPLLLGPQVMAAILQVLAPWFSADRVLSGVSPFAEREHVTPWAKAISITDDPQNLFPFDLEGVQTQKTILIREGELTNLLYDTYTATRENRLSTGHLHRDRRLTFPQISHTHLFVEPSETSIDSLLSAAPEMLWIPYVDRFELAPGSSSTLLIEGLGWRVQRGEIAKALWRVPLRLDLFQLMRQAATTGNDLTFYETFGSPSTLFENIPLGL